MAVVCLATEVLPYKSVLELVHILSGKIKNHSLQNPSNEDSEPHICLTTNEEDMPFKAHTANHLSISIALLDSLCEYLKLSPENYLFLCYLLGTAQRKALEHNALLQSHDLIHPAHDRCLFNTTGTSQDYIVQLDNPLVCRGCHDFYHALGCDGEMLLIREMLQEIKQNSPKIDKKPTKNYPIC